ncbi:acyl-CoA thioesterase II [Propionimicrobium sp. PCR01-08-3]|uniref:acyl-CoA thioesterase n=1 Tax=Propionimicrobium sp. PCR01-08-3 TaxID=3052086 RepID=UPI00255C5EA4|nr:acyl-CoA thioesterase II [Propionimicrobium sp. PCR01-08-3]WIY83686.1 acyl-CoA thioesterase II [Propionimicrobium sp. PCR01-08-3]
MPANTAELLQLLDLSRFGQASFLAAHPRTRMQRTYGGQILAQALTAAYQTVPEQRVAHSLHAYFLRPGEVSTDTRFDVQSLRDGNTFSTRRVEAKQQQREIFAGSVSFHRMEPGLDHADPMPESVPTPEECPRLVDEMDRRFGAHSIWHEWDALDVRFAGDSSPGGIIKPGRHVASMRVWVRTQDRLPDDPRVHQAVLAYLSDLTLLSVSAVPHPVVFMSNELQTASIDHAVWFHRPFRADDWLLYDMFSPSASAALGFSNGRLFQEGKLIASCAQEGLIRQVTSREMLS